MDPFTIGAVLLAVITGTSETLGGQLWAGVVSLVSRPLRHKFLPSQGEVGSGKAELAALQQAPTAQQQAVTLARVLLARAAADEEFAQALGQWWQRAEPVRAGLGKVTSVISGGTQQGPVLMGRDFTGITFGASPAPPPVPGSPDPDTPQ
jgi:hypothetical protein